MCALSVDSAAFSFLGDRAAQLQQESGANQAWSRCDFAVPIRGGRSPLRDSHEPSRRRTDRQEVLALAVMTETDCRLRLTASADETEEAEPRCDLGGNTARSLWRQNHGTRPTSGASKEPGSPLSTGCEFGMSPGARPACEPFLRREAFRAWFTSVCMMLPICVCSDARLACASQASAKAQPLISPGQLRANDFQKRKRRRPKERRFVAVTCNRT